MLIRRGSLRVRRGRRNSEGIIPGTPPTLLRLKVVAAVFLQNEKCPLC